MPQGSYPRPELRGLLAAVALALGIALAPAYARLTAPVDAALARFLVNGHPWEILAVTVDAQPGAQTLRLVAAVRRRQEDSAAAAVVITRMNVGAAVETPLVFWTLILLWPVNIRPWRLLLRRTVLGVPIFLVLYIATTMMPLLSELPTAAAQLGGEPDHLTATQWWSQFLETGGRVVLELCAALLTVALSGVGKSSRIRHIVATVPMQSSVHETP